MAKDPKDPGTLELPVPVVVVACLRVSTDT